MTEGLIDLTGQLQVPGPVEALYASLDEELTVGVAAGQLRELATAQHVCARVADMRDGRVRVPPQHGRK